MFPWEWTKKPWSRLHIDHAGPFQGSLFLIVVHSYSKWLEVIRVSSTEASATINTLRSLFAMHGIPDTIVSDNGSGFTSKEFGEFIENNGIRHILTSPKHPASNDQAERMVATTKDALRRIITGNWQIRLARFLLAQHATPSATTGASPAELLMGRRLKTCLDRLHPDFAESMSHKQEERQDISFANANLRVFAPFDNVYVRGFGKYAKWVPATVIEVTGPVSYRVETEDKKVWRRHIDQLRRRVLGEDLPVEIPENRTLNGTNDNVRRPAEPSAAVSEDAAEHQDNLNSPGSPSRTSESVDEAPQRRVQPAREHRLPDRFKDFELGGRGVVSVRSED